MDERAMWQQGVEPLAWRTVNASARQLESRAMLILLPA